MYVQRSGVLGRIIGRIILHKTYTLRQRVYNRNTITRSEKLNAPWSFGFQCNERYLQWDKSAQKQLLKLVVAEKLDLTAEQFDSRIVELTSILPDIAETLEMMKANILLQLIKDPSEIADRVLYLKSTLPNLDLSTAMRRYPEFIASYSKQELHGYVTNLIEEFEGDVEKVGDLLSKEPRCLTVSVAEAIKEVNRLMPKEPNPRQRFLQNPCDFLSMEQLGMLSSN